MKHLWVIVIFFFSFDVPTDTWTSFMQLANFIVEKYYSYHNEWSTDYISEALLLFNSTIWAKMDSLSGSLLTNDTEMQILMLKKFLYGLQSFADVS